MFKRLLSTALIFGAAAMAPPAHAQSMRCMPRDHLVQKLGADYAEQLTGGGLQNAQQLLEIWTSEKTGSFTVFVTRPNGQSCVMATGSHWNSTVTEVKEGVTG